MSALWLAACPDSAAPAIPESCLTLHELARLERLPAPARARSRAANLLLGRLCADVLACDVSRIAVGRDLQGRPLVSAPRAVQASLSHGGGWVAAALRLDHPLGVDIERTKAIPAAVQTEILTGAEQDWATGAPDRIMALWCLKEAWMKATGDGLRRDPRAAGFAIGETRVIPQGDAAGWHAALLHPEPGLALACCSPAPFTLRFFRPIGESTP